MDKTIPALMGIVIVEYSLLWFAAKRGLLGNLIILNMVLIAFLGGKLFQIAGFESNVGNLFYSPVIAAQALVFYRAGVNGVKENIKYVCFALSTIFTLSYLLSVVAPVAGNLEISNAIKLITDWGWHLVAVSFLAFWVAQQVFILLFRMRPDWLGYLFAAIVAQLLDSLIFFTVVFGRNEGGKFLQTLSIGFVVKVLFAVITIPLIGHYRQFSFQVPAYCPFQGGCDKNCDKFT